MLTHAQALDLYQSDDLIGIGMEADAVRRKLHPEGVATYIIDRNINYTNFCTEYCTFCAFYRPLKGPRAKEGYILDFDTIYDKIRETVEVGGTGVLMQGGLHPDLKIDWHEKMLRGIRQRFPKVHLHCCSASEKPTSTASTTSRKFSTCRKRPADSRRSSRGHSSPSTPLLADAAGMR